MLQTCVSTKQNFGNYDHFLIPPRIPRNKGTSKTQPNPPYIPYLWCLYNTSQHLLFFKGFFVGCAVRWLACFLWNAWQYTLYAIFLLHHHHYAVSGGICLEFLLPRPPSFICYMRQLIVCIHLSLCCLLYTQFFLPSIPTTWIFCLGNVTAKPSANYSITQLKLRISRRQF